MLVSTRFKRDDQISVLIHVQNMKISKLTCRPSYKTENMKLCDRYSVVK